METTQLTPSVPQKPRIRRGYNPHLFYVDWRTQPGTIHMVLTTHSGHCTCAGFRSRGRCDHVDFYQDYELRTAALAVLGSAAA